MSNIKIKVITSNWSIDCEKTKPKKENSLIEGIFNYRNFYKHLRSSDIQLMSNAEETESQRY